MRRLVLLRPEPGLSASIERAESLGIEVVGKPLFEVRAVEWTPPRVSDFDLLLLTSANTLRFGGKGLDGLRVLPVAAIGDATAQAAAQAGFEVRWQGREGVEELVAILPDGARVLHLAGRDRTDVAAGQMIHAVTVYAAEATAPGLPLDLREGDVVALHSMRAAAAFAARCRREAVPAGLTLIALSGVVATATGPGWPDVRLAEAPTDAALLALAAGLCLESGQ